MSITKNINESLRETTVKNVLRPLKYQWNLKSYSDVIERIYKEWKEYQIIKMGK